MNRNRVVHVCLFLAMTAVSPLLAQPAEGLPPGKWWDRQEVVRRLALSSEQRSNLDRIFRSNASDLIDLRGEVEKRSIDLRGHLDQSRLDRPAIQEAATRLSAARGRLFEREILMFVEMRSVLAEEQWDRFRQMLASRMDQGNERRPFQGGQPPARPGQSQPPRRRP